MFEYLGPKAPVEVLKLNNRKGFINIALKTGILKNLRKYIIWW